MKEGEKMKMRNYFCDTLQEAITRGKGYYKHDPDGFYIKTHRDKFFLSDNPKGNNIIKHMVNKGKFNEKPEWIEIDINN
jgi:hypothetical protein